MGGRAFSGDGMRDMLADDRVWTVLATVALHEGESQHYATNDDGDLEVTVVTNQHRVEIRAVLGALVGGAGRGVWMIPDVGTEVMVAFADGDFEGDAVIVGAMPSRSVPAGLVPGKVIVKGATVEVDATSTVTITGTAVHVGGTPSEPTVKATTYRGAEDTLLTAIGAWVTATQVALVSIPTFIDPAKATYATATGALTAAITAFQTAAATYLTTIAKVR